MIHSAGAGVNTPARIPFAFRADPVALDGLDLDATARAAFVLILDNAKSRGWRSRLSNSTIGRILGRCPMTISRALGRLEAAGLILRELAAGGRIRTGILITWEGVRREGRTGRPSVRREDLTGPARAPEGLGARAELIRSGIQDIDQTGPILPLSEDPETQVPTGAEAAAFLRAMIRAGRGGVGGSAAPAAPVRVADAGRAKVARKEGTPEGVHDLGGPATPQQEVRRVVERMAGAIGFDARRSASSPPNGRRRVPLAEQNRRLEEWRRRRAAEGRFPGNRARRPTGDSPGITPSGTIAIPEESIPRFILNPGRPIADQTCQEPGRFPGNHR